MISHRRAQSGFTLLEVLMAVTLLALLMAMAFGTLRGAISTTRSGERIVSNTNQTRTVQEFLRRQLSHAMNSPFERDDEDGQNRVFEADRDQVRFVAPMPGHLSNGGPHVQWISIERGELLFDFAQLNGFDPDDPKAANPRDPVVLMSGFVDAHFEYRGLDDEGELGEWSSEWEDVTRLPLVVRLVVEFDEPAREWPDLEVPVLVGNNAPALRIRRQQQFNRSQRRGTEQLR